MLEQVGCMLLSLAACWLKDGLISNANVKSITLFALPQRKRHWPEREGSAVDALPCAFTRDDKRQGNVVASGCMRDWWSDKAKESVYCEKVDGTTCNSNDLLSEPRLCMSSRLVE